ncbi:DnaA/Hda family protein [Tuwongella immobilis]|uniref:Chromosomal replication initiator protein DnaA n=1 Tax=Tuwongella immobilis TaxID=692036 RepID=A0A6C2YGF1_9BACT|nr:helix-turn-helix domain-containing protein [Tuwongella immobilis]VIP00566.1 chromosomal replication initiator protein : Chromosomal replication initiator protein DnaA OS=Solitalea canadensis (strain ATCC 29591 / DSM 3403 / NBRC 15130 / NCIMB 12057 / USAM 9D) GN=dnaA PE=3 SV=1: Bac_DnaA: Bac_DnaA_C [Tuwongella immobilis]VTR96550.1 chromosomal replication initiator protein : Chromosomal replication initiator protein DnaA OS=Solitalea canadensis (strain ATCC 29591 / DSM 3403 / NBRC 15130 / NCIMB 
MRPPASSPSADDTLARFVRLPENRSAWLAIQREVRRMVRGRRSSRLLCLHGGPGTGKTHLASGMLERVMQQLPGVSVRQLSAADYERLSAEGRPGSTIGTSQASFRMEESAGDSSGTVAGESPDLLDAQIELESLRDCDLLVVEDLQHLSDRASASLSNLFDHRQSRGRGVVLTCSPGPGLLTHLSRRLTSRMAGGLVVHLEPLSPRSRRRMVRQWIESRRLHVTPAVIHWIADHGQGGGARPLLGAVNQLEQLARLHPPPLDLPLVTGPALNLPLESGSDLERIAFRVAEQYRLPLALVRSRSRHQHAVLPRQVAMYLARQITNHSLVQIGGYFGGRDHATVLHACRKMEQRLETDVGFVAMIRSLQSELS